MRTRACFLVAIVTSLALTVVQSYAQSVYTPYTFTTLAGNAGYGSAEGTGSAARFNGPSGVAVDSAGNVYVADTDNHVIRKSTASGVVSTVAGFAGSFGSADGTAGTARFHSPSGVAVDGEGSVYVADTGNHTIRKVTSGGAVTTLAGRAGVSGSADGTGIDAAFNQPHGLAIDGAGNVYVADTWNETIRKVTPTGVVTTLAGAGIIGSADGAGSNARFFDPYGVAVDLAGNVFVADTWNSTIRRVTPSGVVTTLAGVAGRYGAADGVGAQAIFFRPYGVAVDAVGNVLVADAWNCTLRKVTPSGMVTTLAGRAGTAGSVDGTGITARFNKPFGVAVDTSGQAFLVDTGNHTVRKVTPTGGVTTLAGLAGGFGNSDGIGSTARFYQPSGVAVDGAGNAFVTDTFNHSVRKVTPAGVVTTLAGLADNPGSADGIGTAARFNQPFGVGVDYAGNVVVADTFNHTIRKATAAAEVTTLAGLPGRPGSADGTGGAAEFNHPQGVTVDSTGTVYVADTGNHVVRKVTTIGVVTTLAGLAANPGAVDAEGSEARFRYPAGVAVDSVGTIYVVDTGNQIIRKVTAGGVVTTMAGLAGSSGSTDGAGSDARFSDPLGVAVDSAGNVYVADEGNQTIRKVTPSGYVTTVGGSATSRGSGDGVGRAARFFFPYGVGVDGAGNVYVADTYNNTIRKGFPAPMILNSGPGFGFNGGQFGFGLTGPAGQLVVVETSTDLVSWLPLWTNTFAGSLNFSDPQSGAFSNRFYRARLP